MRLALLLTLPLWLVAACGGADEGREASANEKVAAATHAPVTAQAGGTDVRVVDESEANFILYVSNQSFDDEQVRLAVAVDGVTVVDDEFDVEGQHNWVQFPLQLAPGSHEITAQSDTEATLRESFETPRGGTRYAVIDHWTNRDDSAFFTWRFQRQVMAFY
ncbi:MAG: hypothetical protein F2693_15385 [Actinobacteria bacterium]|nr:hypothetical protein [Actinomycetota bacterium]